MTKTPKKQPAMPTQRKPRKQDPELKELKRLYRRHETETLHVLQKRLKRLNALAADKERGMPNSDLSRRYEVNPAQLKRLLAEHALYLKDELSAASIMFDGSAQFRDRKDIPQGLFWKRMHRVIQELETARGLRKALEQDPQQATFADFANRLLIINVRFRKKLRPYA